MFDLSDVISKVKKELPHTKPRLRKQTYRSMLVMKKRNHEIAEQLRIQLGNGEEDDKEISFFKKPRLHSMLKKEAPTLIELRENAYYDKLKEHGPNY